MNEVVITGIGIIAPSGVGKAEFWRNNTAGPGCLSPEPLMERIGCAAGLCQERAGSAWRSTTSPASCHGSPD